MTADVSDKNLLGILFEFYSPSNPLQIDGVNELPIDEQLNILRLDRISSVDKRKELMVSLYDKLPNLKDAANKRARFESILSSFYKSYTELKSLPPVKWSNKQLPQSLFIYLLKELQIPHVNEKDKKMVPTFCQFIHFTIKFCKEESFDGEQLHVFYNEVTNNGTKTGGFGLRFVKKICNKYSLKFGKFAKVKKKVGRWYSNPINETMKIYVKTMKGKTISLDLRPNYTIQKVKAIIEEQCILTIPSQQCILTFAGKRLENAKSLSDYNIQQESTLHFVIEEPKEEKKDQEKKEQKDEHKDEQQEEKKEQIDVLKTIIGQPVQNDTDTPTEMNMSARILRGLAQKLKSFKLSDSKEYQKRANITCTSLEKCISIQRIVATIKLYQQSNHNIYSITDVTDTINDLIVSHLLCDYDHLINYHLKNKTLSFIKYVLNSIKSLITINIGQCDETKCKCSINGNIVDVLHSYLLHPHKACSNTYEKIQTVSAHIPSPDNIPHYQFGRKFYYWPYYKYNNEKEAGANKGYRKKDWYITKKYDSFKDEILNNNIHSLDAETYQSVLEQCIQYSQQSYAKSLRSDTFFAEYYEIRPGTPISVENIISVNLWTDWSNLATLFSATFRYINSQESDESLKQRNREFWHWGKTLAETVHLYGIKMGTDKIKSLYYGLNLPLLFGEFVAYFCGPAGFTSKLMVAHNFTDGKGVILEVVQTNEFSNLKYFPASHFCCFPNDDDRVFFGSDKPIKFRSIMTVTDGKNYRTLMPALALLHNVVTGIKPADKTTVASKDLKFVSRLLQYVNPDVTEKRHVPPYIVNCFKMYCDCKDVISIHIELMKTYYEKLCKHFIDEQFDNLLKLEFIVLTFPKASIINVYSVGNISDLYVDALIIKCERLFEMKANVMQINFHDIKYNQQLFDCGFVSKFGDRFIFEGYCTISVATKMQKITNADETVTQIPEYSILKILRST